MCARCLGNEIAIKQFFFRSDFSQTRLRFVRREKYETEIRLLGGIGLGFQAGLLFTNKPRARSDLHANTQRPKGYALVPWGSEA